MTTPNKKFIPYGFFYFSETHITSAAMFAKEAEKIELQSEKKDYVIAGELERSNHTSYVVSSVIMSVAFLEAFINEIFVSLDYETAYSGLSGRRFRRHPDTKPETSGHLVG